MPLGFDDWRDRPRNWGSSSRRTTPRRPTVRRPTNTGLSASFNVPQSEQRYTPAGYNSPLHNQYVAQHSGNGVPVTRQGYGAYVDQWNSLLNSNAAPGSSISGGGGGGGGGYGYGGGGGGGGGGGPAMTQALLDSMLSVLGARAPGLALQQTALPAFRGTNLPAFNAAPYTTATNQLNAGAAADRAAAQAASTRATQALQQNYTNPYANTQVQQTPAAPQVGAALQQTAGGGGDQAAQAAQSNAAAASDQASFANLLNVLGATDQATQSSRLNQVALDQNTALANIGAQTRGLAGGINMAQAQARNQWGMQDAERRYQNSLMAQQWQREGMMRNQDIGNQQRQANWQQGNEFISSRLTPLLELLGSTGGAPGLNMTALQNLIKQMSAGAR